MRTTTRCGMALFVAVSLGRAAAQMNEVPGKGRGTGRDSTTSPPTRSAGTAAESAGLAAHDLPFSPRRGLMGAPGAAPDEAGPARLGGHGERSWRPSFGESAQPGPGGEAYEPWKSGDRIRSWSSADVRAARVQQAPDLEWAPPSGGRPPGTRGEPQEPYGVRFSLEQQAPLR